jgi:hypothetical protein
MSLANSVQAHGPDLSSLMIYDQNGKYFLALKSSLTAFEGEIDYLFSKDSYKSAEAFQLLVLKHFRNNCFVVVNGDTIQFTNPKVVLGHETTLIAELLHFPKKVESIYVRNTLFMDMPANMCEIILTMKGFPLQQYILNNDNKYEVQFELQNEQWTVKNSGSFWNHNKQLLLLIVLFLAATIVLILAKRKRRTISPALHRSIK